MTSQTEKLQGQVLLWWACQKISIKSNLLDVTRKKIKCDLIMMISAVWKQYKDYLEWKKGLGWGDQLNN